jgi:hypothetical protein
VGTFQGQDNDRFPGSNQPAAAGNDDRERSRVYAIASM